MKHKYIKERENLHLKQNKLMAMFAELDPDPVFRFDSQGKILFLDKYSSDFIQLDMKNYSSGFYMLKVKVPESKILQNFKIQKIN